MTTPTDEFAPRLPRLALIGALTAYGFIFCMTGPLAHSAGPIIGRFINAAVGIAGAAAFTAVARAARRNRSTFDTLLAALMALFALTISFWPR